MDEWMDEWTVQRGIVEWNGADDPGGKYEYYEERRRKIMAECADKQNHGIFDRKYILIRKG
jgi:hypothetical protein